MPTPTLQDMFNLLGKQGQILRLQQSKINQLIAALAEISSRPRSLLEEIDALPGRRTEGTLSGDVAFTATDEGNKGTPVVLNVNQDGPFVMTHYPFSLWRPTQPTNAQNYGKWRPVSSFPLPTQQIGTDIIDIMYELFDGGSMRQFQNAPRGPILSRPDNIVPLPIPVVFPSNSVVQFIPTYNAIDWTQQGELVETTQGTLHVDLIGYRINNL